MQRTKQIVPACFGWVGETEKPVGNIQVTKQGVLIENKSGGLLEARELHRGQSWRTLKVTKVMGLYLKSKGNAVEWFSAR